MLPILINSFLNILVLLAVTTQLVNNPVSKVKLMHIIFKAKLLEVGQSVCDVVQGMGRGIPGPVCSHWIVYQVIHKQSANCSAMSVDCVIRDPLFNKFWRRGSADPQINATPIEIVS